MEAVNGEYHQSAHVRREFLIRLTYITWTVANQQLTVTVVVRPPTSARNIHVVREHELDRRTTSENISVKVTIRLLQLAISGF